MFANIVKLYIGIILQKIFVKIIFYLCSSAKIYCGAITIKNVLLFEKAREAAISNALVACENSASSKTVLIDYVHSNSDLTHLYRHMACKERAKETGTRAY